jgi:hypothetical protein
MPRRPKRRLLTDLIKTANGKSPRGMFSHAISVTADDVAKKGLRQQLQFLITHLGPVQTQTLVEDLLKLEQEINNLTSQAVRGDRLRLLVRTTYDLKMKEAHQVAHAKPRTVVRHLVRILGVDKVNKLINGV